MASRYFFAIVKRTATGYRLVASGVITTASTTPLGNRLDQHFVRLHEILKTHTPDLVSIESVFFNRNISSCISTASVIAIAELASEQAGIPALQINPQKLKTAVTGSGTASKHAVKKMLNKITGATLTNGHEADAAAAAIAGLLQPTDPLV